jgi:hypothetical protein
MGKGLLLFVALALGLTGCDGTAGPLPADYETYGFKASVQVATLDPRPGQSVELNVALQSVGNTPVRGDVVLHVVSEGGTSIDQQQWDDVLFMPRDEWNLNNGFLAATDVEKTYRLAVEVRRHDTGELLVDAPDAGTLTFSST